MTRVGSPESDRYHRASLALHEARWVHDFMIECISKMEAGANEYIEKPNFRLCYLMFLFVTFRIKLNEESTLNIAAIDPDDDYVKCGQALYMEAGIFSLSSLALSGVTITEVGLRLTFYVAQEKKAGVDT